jgi:predicted O-methyltransferase YrrM
MREEQAARREESHAAARAGDWRDRQLLAVGPDTGRLINILARSLETPTILELGTSYGYSGIWLAEAARATGGRLITMELQDYKSAHAREMATTAGLADHIDFKIGDAVQMIGELQVTVDFVLVDLWKDLHLPCLEAFLPKLNRGAIIVADNMLCPGGEDVSAMAKPSARKPGSAACYCPWERESKSAGSTESLGLLRFVHTDDSR